MVISNDDRPGSDPPQPNPDEVPEYLRDLAPSP